MTVRHLSVRWRPIQSYATPQEAIHAAKQADEGLRTSLCDQVKDRIIERVEWSDSAMAIALDDGGFLNIVAEVDGVACTVSRSSFVPGSADPIDVAIEAEGSTIRWRRAVIARRFIGSTLTRLFFAQEGVYIYAGPLILLCVPMDRIPGMEPCLYWCESG